MRMAKVWWTATLGWLSLVACGGGNGDGAGASPSMGSTAKQVCDDACAALVVCGLPQDPMCSVKCQNAGAAHVACLHAVNSDCNGVATCILGTLCGGHPPAGTAACGATAACEGTCNVQNPTLSCGCSCIAAMSPSTSFKLILNNECANYAACPSCNPATFDGANCNACAAACVAAGPCSHS